MSRYSRTMINPYPGYLVMIADSSGTVLRDNSESASYTWFVDQQPNRKTTEKSTKAKEKTQRRQTHDNGIDDNKPHG